MRMGLTSWKGCCEFSLGWQFGSINIVNFDVVSYFVRLSVEMDECHALATW